MFSWSSSAPPLLSDRDWAWKEEMLDLVWPFSETDPGKLLLALFCMVFFLSYPYKALIKFATILSYIPYRINDYICTYPATIQFLDDYFPRITRFFRTIREITCSGEGIPNLKDFHKTRRLFRDICFLCLFIKTYMYFCNLRDNAERIYELLFESHIDDVRPAEIKPEWFTNTQRAYNHVRAY